MEIEKSCLDYLNVGRERSDYEGIAQPYEIGQSLHLENRIVSTINYRRRIKKEIRRK